MKNKTEINENTMDNCVNCGQKTGHQKNDHIDSRFNYVEGVGQLCPQCYNEIYKK